MIAALDSRAVNASGPANAPAPAAPPQSPPVAAPQPEDSFSLSRSDFVQVGLPVVVGAGLGVYAGAATGVLAAVAGAATGLLGGAMIGLMGARIASNFAKYKNDAFTRLSSPMAIGGALVGLVGGGIVGATVANPLAAVAMGVVGAAGGLTYALFHALSNRR